MSFLEKDNTAYQTALNCFDSISEKEQSQTALSASFAINFLIDIEPRLAHDLGKHDFLQLEIVADTAGQGGDVRDVLAIRSIIFGLMAKEHERSGSNQWFPLKDLLYRTLDC